MARVSPAYVTIYRYRPLLLQLLTQRREYPLRALRIRLFVQYLSAHKYTIIHTKPHKTTLRRSVHTSLQQAINLSMSIVCPFCAASSCFRLVWDSSSAFSARSFSLSASCFCSAARARERRTSSSLERITHSKCRSRSSYWRRTSFRRSRTLHRWELVFEGKRMREERGRGGRTPRRRSLPLLSGLYIARG